MKGSFVFVADSWQQDGQHVMRAAYESVEAQSLSLLCIASLTDVATFLRQHEGLFRAKTREVVIMGGVNPPLTPQAPAPGDAEAVTGELLTPDTAHNNEFDRDSARYVYQQCQLLGIPLVVVSRQTGSVRPARLALGAPTLPKQSRYACPVPREIYDSLGAVGHPVGVRLHHVQRQTIEQLWRRACSAPASPQRAGLPERCDRSWFLGVFCGGVAAPDVQGTDSVWELVQNFIL
jgi:hypothetical protein